MTQKLMKLRVDLATLSVRVEPSFMRCGLLKLEHSGWTADLQARVALDEFDDEGNQKMSTMTLVHFGEWPTIQAALRHAADYLDGDEIASFASSANT